MRLLFGPGQQNDMAQAQALEGLAPEAEIADKGYDADPLHDVILEAGAEPVIPPRRHRRRPRAYDRDLYKERNCIERVFNKLNQFRRVATRYDKLPVNFRGFVQLAAIAIMLA